MAPLDFLDAQSGEPEETPALDTAAPPIDEPQGPARGPDGKFVSAAPAEEPELPPQAQEPSTFESTAPTVPPGFVPVSALQELRQEIRQLKQAPPPPPQPAPDRYEDPEGYEAHREQQFEQRLLNERLNNSERFAKREYGADTVATARNWALEKFQNDPLYYQQVMSNADPYEAVVQDWKREQVLSSMKDGDLDAFLAWKAGQAPPQAPPQHAAPAAPPVVAPPRSLASAPNAGGLKPGEQPVGPGVAYGALFKG